MNHPGKAIIPDRETARKGLAIREAMAIIAAAIEPVAQCETVDLSQSLARVLAEDVRSPRDVPMHDNAAMDGYAVAYASLSADGPTRLAIGGRIMAGDTGRATLAAGGCMRIMTGAVLPDGCDTVVAQEHCTVEDGSIVVPPGYRRFENTRRRGEDLTAGEAALPAGRRLGPADLGVLASLGCADVSVRRRLRVAHFSTGDEVRSPGDSLAIGQVYDSNRFTIGAMLDELGIERLDLGIVRDDPRALRDALAAAADYGDAIITSGGVSVGEADFTREVLAQSGDIGFWKLAMKPGRPMAFGQVVRGDRRVQFFGLPGNPVAVMVTFQVLVAPALARMAGAHRAEPLLFAAYSEAPLAKPSGRLEYIRGVATNRQGIVWVRPTGEQGSGILTSMRDANCFIVLDESTTRVSTGDTVMVWPMRERS